MAEGVYMLGKEKAICGCVLVVFYLFLDLAQPFRCLFSIDVGVCSPEREDLHPFFVGHNLLWHVKF